MPTKRQPITVEHLWQIDRIGAPSLSPDGAQAVASVTRHSMEDNQATASLWLFSTLGGKPRALTHCGEKDGSPRWSPHPHGTGNGGEQIAFIAKREQQGHKDDEPQLYVIAPDGGEARRVGPVATGVEAFRWMPDGQRIVFVSWVRAALVGAKAQAKAHAEFKKRKETAYVTSESMARYWDHFIPMDRVPRLHLIDVTDEGGAKPHDLFEGTPYELTRTEPDADNFDISPDGRRIVFAFDPATVKQYTNRFALAELDLKTGRIEEIVRDADWHCNAPRYSPDGNRIAFVASHMGLKHTMPPQLAVWQRPGRESVGGWEVVSAQWDHAVHAPLQWEDDGMALLFTAEQRGRQHLWRFDLADRRAEVAAQGGWVSHYDKAAGTLVTLAEASDHPGQLFAHLPGRAARRIETFNNRLLAGLDLGRVEEQWFEGAQGDEVQMWVFLPPGFDAKRKYPLLQVIHGGPHTSVGDNWHYRWNNRVFAAQGYVVAVVNYHGSSGFGYAFLDSITHRWGELELQDVEAATDSLLRKPWIDHKRVYASGGSYGGYMVAWMNGHVKPGRYAAYVCHAGCFDWVGMFAEDAYVWAPQELGASYWADMARVHAQSPHAFAGQMHTPTLVIHGALDYRVPDAQGLAYFHTLKARGVAARLVWFPDENHWVLKPRNSRLWYREFFEWLRGHEGAAGKAGRAAVRR